uniref:WD repeat, SAM and U-box domain-containing protein 1 n=1 Tax=Ficedula albicollis TaxID=59894 RepID=A0A803VF37_FICAL
MATLIHTLADHSDDVNYCAFSPSYLATCSLDKTIRNFTCSEFKSCVLLLFRSGKVKDGSLMACAFSPNGSFFVTGSSSGDLTIWDDKMRCLYNEKAHDLGVTCCDISSHPVSDSENGFKYFQMASCGQDNQIKLWLILFADFLGVQLKYKCTLNGHSAPVLACAFSCDGQMIVSGSVDKCVIIYETSTGNILHTLSQHTRYVTTCAFAPHSALLATGSMDKTVHIWQLDLKQSCADIVENESKVAVENWSEDDVSAWLCAQDLADFVGLFKMNNIDGKELLKLTKESLANELKIESLGLRSKVLQKIEELRRTTISVSVPDEFLCPITRELMKDPVIATDGYSYEREAMENWISNRRSSPMTNLPLQSLMLTPNRTLKMAISRWLETQQK